MKYSGVLDMAIKVFEITITDIELTKK